MKKIILSLIALFAAGAVSAQSYPKQPDRTIVEYVPYQKPVREEVKEQPADAVPVSGEKTVKAVKEEKNTREVKNNIVAVNDEKTQKQKQ